MSPGEAAVGPWPEADRLFREDPLWVGGDDAYSIPLDGRRRLWLFGDTFVAQRPGGGRRTAAFIHSSVAIQDGTDPTVATMSFVWRTDADGRPASFLPDDGDGGYRWPGHGARVGERLVLFAMRVRDRPRADVDTALETLTFFEPFGWDAFVTDPVGDPREWTLEPARLPDHSAPLLVGNAGVLVDGGHLVAHGWDERRAYVLRWELGAAAEGDLRHPEWWCGQGQGWLPAGESTPAPTIEPSETEFTVHRDPVRDEYVHVQMPGLFEPRLEVRTAHRVEGPWSPPVSSGLVPPAGSFAYAGKAHPGLSSPDLAITYNTIPLTVDGIRDRPDLYAPRFLRLSR